LVAGSRIEFHRAQCSAQANSESAVFGHQN
jgi:hypothetical protein